MVEIGGKPILWHIMKIYAHHGFTDFVVCLGYKGYVIKEYFANYFLHMSDVTFDLAKNKLEVHHAQAEPWRVTLVDTGDATLTGGRVKRVARYIDDEFMLTYGDGDGAKATGFREKPVGDGGWINGGFFVLSKKVIDYIDGDATSWEKEPMERIAADGQLSVHLHNGFWQPMDTLRDRAQLEAMWTSGRAPWKVWS